MGASRRQQIVDAARAILAEDPESTLAVRAVAERAGIGASTLRHYFPTQQALHEAIFATALDDLPPDLRIHDTSVPAATRLRECLVQLLPPPQPMSRAAADRMLTVLSTTFGSGSTAEARNTWGAYTVRTLDAIAGWLGVLADQGAIPGDGLRQRARFLLTVVEGLALSRIVPVARPSGDEEQGVLDDALSVVFRDAPSAGE
ncbi:TetR/AcrR family transcriptional regulator [Lentzea sp. DG1S-22]|uniref:TetR/AcrR family transcriptional regulator n=1 Tax=Lentzea sp. DG1S-22 TaxID=3108822 RepID=UPI002E76A3CB|nr:TetR/AcrR family transcriptional regulator [Lentzea sp. DG1S-22]WVH83309.1 TetR/AcrR family transcriptional regulator [Lentzea sp. DG1S-22]